MNCRILKRPQVERDLVEHFSFIAQDKIEPADRFLRVADESFRFLAKNPGVVRHEIRRFRSLPAFALT